MTFEQKHFIDLSDVASMRFECKGCHASLQLGLQKFTAGTLFSCPNCNAEWALMHNGMATNNAEGPFDRFAQAVRDIENVMENSPIGFRFSIEIKASGSDKTPATQD